MTRARTSFVGEQVKQPDSAVKAQTHFAGLERKRRRSVGLIEDKEKCNSAQKGVDRWGNICLL
jgi:hypothetical protein